MNKLMIFRIKSVLLLLLALFFSQSMVSATVTVPQNNDATLFKGGVWQTIVDGHPGEGALFFRLHFESDGTLIIIKQCGGSDNITEKKTWSQQGNMIAVKSNKTDIISEFDGESLQIINNTELSYQSNGHESIVKPYKPTVALIHWLLIIVVLIALNEIFRRNKWAVIAFFVILPLVLTPLVWSQHGVTYWFKWAKVYSVVFAVIWFTLIRFTQLGNRNWAKLIAALFLAINIMEAVSQDFSMAFWPNILNGIAGVLNTITLFYGWKQIKADNSPQKDMIWPGMTTFWIIAYDIWNIVYVYLNFPGSTSAQFMVIASCTIPALFIKRGTWLQARAFTLAVWFMYYFTFPRFTEQMELMVPRSYNLMLAVAAISFAANVVYFFVFVKMLRKKKAEIQLT